MKVELLSYTDNPEKAVALAAKLCYSSSDIEGISCGLDDAAVEKFLGHLVSLGHESPVEHVSFTFGVEGVSRSLLAQLTRHRIASYSVKSQRYVNEGGFDYVTPPEIDNSPDAKRIYDDTMRIIQDKYNEIAEILKENHIKNGVSASAAQKLANEDARFVLPNGCETKLIMTFNARSLYNFFRHRCCERAQWEIRGMADEMLRLVKGVAPVLFKNSGPACLTGSCGEGSMSCGKIHEKRSIYLK